MGWEAMWELQVGGGNRKHRQKATVVIPIMCFAIIYADWLLLPHTPSSPLSLSLYLCSLFY